MCIGFVLDGKFRPESDYNTYTTINVYCICIGRNIPAGKWEWTINVYCICIGRIIPVGKLMPHKQNNNKCVLYLYWTEYSGRKVRLNNQCVLYLYWTEYSDWKFITRRADVVLRTGKKVINLQSISLQCKFIRYTIIIIMLCACGTLGTISSWLTSHICKSDWFVGLTEKSANWYIATLDLALMPGAVVRFTVHIVRAPSSRWKLGNIAFLLKP